ncbi:hypothetical protein BEL04_11005 [Mucilaginibacter sp. PPCGB 2223]|uniref:WD40/YVTN/BNR-like repeat-containing protein n=1 Tax=Mucilaginibacter sp. PPCGB 2223 TaxID=1886027 RepID=UPI000824321C|nr:hypothetical protein [Mucilaginibacter sp. PPCGB 2223]OCX52029.1 hypothetical protein BEL04_11005 [Mucilaginibacter sp. PPCGB 2223]
MESGKNKKTYNTIIAAIVLCILAFASCKKQSDDGAAVTTPVIVPPNDGTANWTRVTTLPNEPFSVIEKINNVIYASSLSSAKIYMSADNGTSWTASSPILPGIEITAISAFKNRIYAGTFLDDTFFSTDNGKTWKDAQNIVTNIASFAAWNNNLYSASYNWGVQVLDTLTNQWHPFINGFPVPFTDRATRVLTIDSTLGAATVNSFAVYDTKQQLWRTHTYPPDVKAPYYVVDMVYNNGTILAQTYADAKNVQYLIRSDDKGLTWHQDSQGFRTDIANYTMMGFGIGVNNYYAIVNQAPNGTWVQKRNKSAPNGASWATGEEFLPKFHSHCIREYNNRIFLATDSGVMLRPMGPLNLKWIKVNAIICSWLKVLLDRN